MSDQPPADPSGPATAAGRDAVAIVRTAAPYVVVLAVLVISALPVTLSGTAQTIINLVLGAALLAIDPKAKAGGS